MREESAQGLTVRPDESLQHCKEYHLGVINELLVHSPLYGSPKTALECGTQGKE